MKKHTERYRRKKPVKGGRRTGLGVSVLLSVGILGMSLSQVMVWAAPKAGGAGEEVGEASQIKAARSASELFEDGQEKEESFSQEVSADSKEAAQAFAEKEIGRVQPEPFLVAIDAGHGGVDSGCMGKIAQEKELNLQIALELEKELTQKGYRVLLLREKDEFQDKLDRVEIANSYQADVFVSIHQNTYEGRDKTVGGIETWYDGTDASRDNQRLALLVHRETVKSTGARGRGVIESTELYVASKTLMPACLIETGFLSNPQEEKLLVSADYQKKLAEGIARGIELYFHPGLMYVPFEEAPWSLAGTEAVTAG